VNTHSFRTFIGTDQFNKGYDPSWSVCLILNEAPGSAEGKKTISQRLETNGKIG
jgi:hypothetical protein